VTRRSAAKAFCRRTCSLSPRTIHVRFRAATAVVDAASNSPPLQFVPEISKLPRMLQSPLSQKLARHRFFLRVNAPSARAQIRFLHRFGVSCGFYAPDTSFSKAISVKNLELYMYS
jgi:hypothetical protein